MNSKESAVAITIAISLVVGLWVGRSYFEAKAYNHVTGKEVSTFDAMFLELRVTNE